MAEVFGIVTGAFGACSLALELLEVTKSIHQCWRRLHDLPSTSREISYSLQNIEQMLTIIVTLADQKPKDHYLISSLARCRGQLAKVKNITEEIEASKISQKLWKIKGALRSLALDEKLSAARTSLGETIRDLHIALIILQL